MNLDRHFPHRESVLKGDKYVFRKYVRNVRVLFPAVAHLAERLASLCLEVLLTSTL